MDNKKRFTKKKSKKERILERKYEIAMMNPLFAELHSMEHYLTCNLARAMILHDVDLQKKLRSQLDIILTIEERYFDKILRIADKSIF